ncbi:MAG: diacylglycerol kinase family lipid kinase, partial [Myxococcales bacterium]|nr:diacylglycerol kinase family lipid kinase [Myxococcales bacterium]
LGILPTGTGNDFARSLGIPDDLDAALDRALEAEPAPIDLGRAGDAPFAGIAGVGIVADVLTYLHHFSRRYRGNWVYPWAVLRTVASYRPLHVSIESPTGSFEGPAMIALAANAPRFGGGMLAAPEASMRDGLLDVVVLGETSRAGLVGLLPRVYRGTHLSDPRCLSFRASRIHLTSDPGAVVYADGEALPAETGGGVEISVDPAALRVAV